MVITRNLSTTNRRYCVVVNGTGYFIEEIFFYKNNEVLVSIGHGWLKYEDGHDVEYFAIPNVEEIKLRRKYKFDKNEVFIVSKGVNIFGEKIAALCIPSDFLGIRLKEYRIVRNTITRYLEAVYVGGNAIFLTEKIKYLNEHLDVLETKYEELYNNVTSFQMKMNKEKSFIEKLEELKAAAKAYYTERDRLDNLTVEQVLQEEGICTESMV